MQNQTVLIQIVEDDRPIRSLIMNTLEMNDYRYIAADCGKSAMMQITSHHPDVILLDLGLPDISGIEIIKRVRTWSLCPIIVISARSEDRDKIEALDAGADDYLTKPFSVDELLARIRSTVRRLVYAGNAKGETEDVFVNGELAICYSSATVKLREEEIHLMPIEYQLLCLLAKNVGRVLTYSYILDAVWKCSLEGDLSSLRVYMASLRKKIEAGGNKGKYIQTHIGIGYRMLKVEEVTEDRQDK